MGSNDAIGFPRIEEGIPHLSVTSKNLSSGAKRGANERQTEQGNTLRGLDLKMAAAKKRKGRNPKNYRTVK